MRYVVARLIVNDVNPYHEHRVDVQPQEYFDVLIDIATKRTEEYIVVLVALVIVRKDAQIKQGFDRKVTGDVRLLYDLENAQVRILDKFDRNNVSPEPPPHPTLQVGKNFHLIRLQNFIHRILFRNLLNYMDRPANRNSKEFFCRVYASIEEGVMHFTLSRGGIRNNYIINNLKRLRDTCRSRQLPHSIIQSSRSSNLQNPRH